jgi:uncharacterized Zn finger protein
MWETVMPPENAEAKGRRYLLEGRLHVRAVTDRHIAATCRGDGEIYYLSGDEQGWSCSCPAATLRCSHLVALRLVTIRPLGLDGPGPNGVEVR